MKSQVASDVVLETRVLVSRTKMKVLVLVLDHEVLVLVLNIWSCLEEKVLQFSRLLL